MVLACTRWNWEGKDSDFPTFLFCNILLPLSDSLAPDFSALRTSSPNGEETKLCNKLIQRERIRNVLWCFMSAQKQYVLKDNLKRGGNFGGTSLFWEERIQETSNQGELNFSSPWKFPRSKTQPSPASLLMWVPHSWCGCYRRGTCLGPGSLLCPAKWGSPCSRQSCTLYPHKCDGVVDSYAS